MRSLIEEHHFIAERERSDKVGYKERGGEDRTADKGDKQGQKHIH